MRTKVTVVFLCGLALLTGYAAAETVEEIVAANLEAKGGEEAWKALES